MNLILFGFKKCGKTYYGLRLSSRMHMRFIDTDLLIEELYYKKHHQELCCREISLKHGVPFFRNLEQEVISSFAQIDDAVISLGGGAVLDPKNVEYLQKMGTLVYLRADRETLKYRILTGELPSYFDVDNPIKSFEKIYEERLPIYEKVKAYCIDTENKDETEVIQSLKELIESVRRSHGK